MTLSIGKLAKSCEINIDTVRYYERIGLLLPDSRTESGYRVYSPKSINRLRFVRAAQSFGFRLNEIKELLELSDRPESDCADIRDYANHKITEIEERISDLVNIKNCLEELSSFCPGEGKSLTECNILKHFYGEKS